MSLLQYIQFGYQYGYWRGREPDTDFILRVRKYGCGSTSLDALTPFPVVI